MKRVLNKSVESNFVKSDLWLNKLKKDCIGQNVFLAIRNDEIDFYHKGGKLFGYDGKDFKTHLKYASVITRKGKDYLTQDELSKYKLSSDFKSNYSRIKENCSNYSGVEAAGVSAIYHKHSYMSSSNVVVLDIETSFKSFDRDRKQDRIDLLLYNIEKRKLQFIEAKHYSNNELWSKTTPKIIKQLSRYRKQINKRKDDIIIAYSNYVRIINRLFNCNLPEPLSIDNDVTLLIFGFDNDQMGGRLKKLITENHEYRGIKNYNKGDIKSVVPLNIWNARIL